MSRSHPGVVSADEDPTDPIAALFDEHCGFVCRVLRHHGVREASLDDAVQDVFVTAYRRWSSFEGRSSARSWLFGIARRIAHRYRRSASTRARHLVSPDVGAPEGAHEPFARVQAAQSLSALLRRIDPDKRAVFVLHEVEGLTAPEVADALGIPLGTAYSRLRAAWQGLGREAKRERTRLRRELSTMRRPDPSPQHRRRMWSMIAGGLGPVHAVAPPAAAASGWLAQVKWWVVGAAVGAGLVGARVAVVASSRAKSEASPTAAKAQRPSRNRASDDVVPPADPQASRPPVRTPVATPDETPPAPKLPDHRDAIPKRPPSARSDRSARGSHDALTAELSLLRRARQAVDDGRGQAALVLLDEHARRFSKGQLADERRRVRIDALCLTGQRQQAENEAKLLGRALPSACARPVNQSAR